MFLLLLLLRNRNRKSFNFTHILTRKKKKQNIKTEFILLSSIEVEFNYSKYKA
jgi:hypothetical protein